MKKHFILFIFFAYGMYSFAQRGTGHRPHFNPEEFKMRLEKHITQEAGFTQEEAKTFFDLFHEMKDKQRKILDEIHNLKSHAPSPTASEKEFSNAVQKAKELKVAMAETEERYYKRMCKSISPQKVYKAMKSEDSFHRKMLNGFNKQRPQRMNGRKKKNGKK